MSREIVHKEPGHRPGSLVGWPSSCGSGRCRRCRGSRRWSGRNGGLGLVGEDEYGFSGVVPTDSEVVEGACPAEGEFAELIDDVSSNSVVNGEGFAVRGGFQCCVEGLFRGLSAEGAVGTLLVVDGPELVELGL